MVCMPRKLFQPPHHPERVQETHCHLQLPPHLPLVLASAYWRTVGCEEVLRRSHLHLHDEPNAVEV